MVETTTTTTSTFSASAAARLGGLSMHMLNYLCRTGVLAPTGTFKRGRGRGRQYTFGDVVVLRAIAKLLSNGISVTKLKRALIALRKRHPEITSTSLPGSLLFTDGKTVYFREGKDVLEDLVKGQFTFGFVIELGSIQREVLEQTMSDADEEKRLSRRVS